MAESGGTRWIDAGRRFWRTPLRAFAADRAGNVVILFSIAAPVLALATGAAVDFARLSTSRASLQAIADGAALAGAQAISRGKVSTLNLNSKAAVSPTAPSSRLFAGVPIFENRATQTPQTHNFKSRNAPNMLGTIYLSRGVLQIGLKGGGGCSGPPVGATSA